MKYLFIIAISLLLAQPALAARQVPGSVPSTTPLQPMPTGAAANVHNNIQFQDQSHQGQFDSAGNLIKGSTETSGDASPTQPAFSVTASPKSAGHLWLWILIIVILGGAGWFLLKGRRG